MKIFTDRIDIQCDYDLSNISPKEQMLLFDIETTGLKKETTQMYLMGCGFYKDGGWNIRQWLTECARDEEEVLRDFLEFASGYKVLVHFNGDGFDIPYIRYKAEYYGIDFDWDAIESFDIYKKARCAKKLLGLEKLGQKSIECFLGIERDDVMNGGLLIPVYYDFERKKDEYSRSLLLLHNYDDVKGMFRILPILSYYDFQQGGFTWSGYEEINGTAVIEYTLASPVPVSIEKTLSFPWGEGSLALDGALLQLNLPIYDGVARIPLEPVSDYYYLPKEDMVIHKDVARFVDDSGKVKATKSNCFLKKEGRFLPQKTTLFDPAFSVPQMKKGWSLFEADNVQKEVQTAPNIYVSDFLDML